PVGAAVGQRGARVQAVVAELGGEKIDIIPWNDDASIFVANALSPAQVIGVDIDEEHRIANVTVPERMLSLAIGREGQNARLAARLTGRRIDIRSDVSVAAKAAEEEGAQAQGQAQAARRGDSDEERRVANVAVRERMLSLAIGGEGENARLGARLTGWRIDIRGDVSVAAKAAEDAAGEAQAQEQAATREAPAAGTEAP